MNRCKFCGRTGTGMLRLSHRGDEWACRERPACGKRAAKVGKWVGKRVLRRHDIDGTCWTIRHHADDGLRGLNNCGPYDSGFVLICEYREHRTYSWHPTVAKAKDHRDDLVRSWEARTMREYTGGRA